MQGYGDRVTLTPPSVVHRPQVVSFKAFGYTSKGLSQWYERINDLSRGSVERLYQDQLSNHRLKPPFSSMSDAVDYLDQQYGRLTPDEVIRLCRKYKATLFVTFSDQTAFEHDARFKLLRTTNRWRLYRVQAAD